MGALREGIGIEKYSYLKELDLIFSWHINCSISMILESWWD